MSHRWLHFDVGAWSTIIRNDCDTVCVCVCVCGKERESVCVLSLTEWQVPEVLIALVRDATGRTPEKKYESFPISLHSSNNNKSTTNQQQINNKSTTNQQQISNNKKSTTSCNTQNKKSTTKFKKSATSCNTQDSINISILSFLMKLLPFLCCP